MTLDGLPHQVDQLEGSLLSEKSAVEERAAQSAAEPLKRALERKETALRSMKLKLEVVQAELSGSRAELEGAKAEVAKREARARKQSEAAHAALGVQLDALCPLPCMQVPTTARSPSFPQVGSATLSALLIRRARADPALRQRLLAQWLGARMALSTAPRPPETSTARGAETSTARGAEMSTARGAEMSPS